MKILLVDTADYFADAKFVMKGDKFQSFVRANAVPFPLKDWNYPEFRRNISLDQKKRVVNVSIRCKEILIVNCKDFATMTFYYVYYYYYSV